MRLCGMRVVRLFVSFTVLALLAAGTLSAQAPRGASAFTDVAWQGYTFHFLPGNQMAQVLDADKHVVGTILMMNGGLQVLPTVTGVEADKLKKAFEEWMDKGGQNALASHSAPSGRAPAGSAPAPGRTANPPASSTARERAPESAAPATSAAAPAPSSHGTLDAATLDKFGKTAAFPFDVHLLRLKPELLEQKPYMRYFIALNNCNDKTIVNKLENELDYPDLVSYYKPRASDILSHLTPTLNAVLFGEAGMWKKLLTLGEYDRAKGSFPLSYGGQPGAEIPNQFGFDFGRTKFRAACPAANQVASSHVNEGMPAAYGIAVKPMSFKELKVDEATARKYIESNPGTQRAVILIVEVRVLDVPPVVKTSPHSMVLSANFTGEIARVTVAKVNGDPVGVLYDDHTLPKP